MVTLLCLRAAWYSIECARYNVTVVGETDLLTLICCQLLLVLLHPYCSRHTVLLAMVDVVTMHLLAAMEGLQM